MITRKGENVEVNSINFSPFPTIFFPVDNSAVKGESAVH